MVHALLIGQAGGQPLGRQGATHIHQYRTRQWRRHAAVRRYAWLRLDVMDGLRESSSGALLLGLGEPLAQFAPQPRGLRGTNRDADSRVSVD